MLKEMKTDMAQIYLHSYFAANDAGDIEGAIRRMEKVTDLQKELKGENSQEVLSNYFLMGQS